MSSQSQTQRRLRTRSIIQLGGLVKKSGLTDAFLIEEGEDLQSYESLHKAAKVLGFLTDVMENKIFNESSLEYWQKIGERYLKNRSQ
ncbi:MAG: conjugal transfer protein TraD [Alphaproteobacteria bacterium]|jgi:ornithine carbamoyltransferase|nr:conjugal transfer protein TraD [Alphaproteobacteria bacterium]